MSTGCTFCGSDGHAHESVVAEEMTDGERAAAGQFCNYVCLAQHLEAARLETGASCQVDLS